MDGTNFETFSERLAFALDQINESEAWLGKQIGTSKQNINRFKTGETRLRVEEVDAMAKALGVDRNWLAFGDTVVRDRAEIDFLESFRQIDPEDREIVRGLMQRLGAKPPPAPPDMPDPAHALELLPPEKQIGALADCLLALEDFQYLLGESGADLGELANKLSSQLAARFADLEKQDAQKKRESSPVES